MKLAIISQYPDAKSMFAAIETRFRGNAATKKTQKTLLKQQYENFSVTSAESLDSIFKRLQKIVSRLAILGVIIAQDDLNLKFLSSLPPEWNTHVVVLDDKLSDNMYMFSWLKNPNGSTVKEDKDEIKDKRLFGGTRMRMKISGFNLPYSSSHYSSSLIANNGFEGSFPHLQFLLELSCLDSLLLSEFLGTRPGISEVEVPSAFVVV
ncbi:hypothetical protein Tco_0497594 [Tanacetum coccineum]